MKRLILLLLPLLLWPASTSAAGFQLDYASGKTTVSTTLPVPVRDVEYLDDGNIRVTYTFSGALLSNNTNSRVQYLWNIAGFGNSTDQTRGAVPMRIDTFMIPEGKSVSVILEECVHKTFDYTMSKGTEPKRDSDSSDNALSSINADTQAETPDAGVSAIPDPISTFYPATNVSLKEIQDYRGIKLVNIQVAAAQYSYLFPNTRAATKLSYLVKFTDAPANAPSKSPSDRRDLRVCVDDLFISNNTDGGNSGSNTGGGLGSGSGSDLPTPQNPVHSGTDLSYKFLSADKTYAILTTDALKASTESFAEWKKIQGYNVVTLSAASWTYETAKAATDALFEQYPDFYHLLIVGGADAVPGKKITSDLDGVHNFHYTDYYFTSRDESPNALPAISVGRIPLSASTDVKETLSKIVRLERNPAKSTTSSKVTSVAYFFDGNGYEKRRFAKTSEEIFYYLNHYIELGTQRIFFAEASANPTNWARSPYSFGEAIPDYLKKPNFPWNGSTNDISTSIKNGTSILTYRGFSNVYGWEKPQFTTSEISLLSNRRLPFVYSICCSTGRYEIPGNFATEFLKTGSNRSCGIIAASSYSPTILNDEFAEALIDAQWPNPGLLPQFAVPTGKTAKTPIGLNSVGEIFNQALKRTGERFSATSEKQYKHLKEIYHIFGDPSMFIHTEPLVDASTFAKITRTDLDNSSTLDGIIRVSLTRNAYIGLYNETTGETKRYYGRSLTYFPAKEDNWAVTVYDANVKPLISQRFEIPPIIPPIIRFTSYNPADNSCIVSVDTTESETDSYSIEVRDSFGNIVGHQTGYGAEKDYVPLQSQRNGVHIVSLIVDGDIVDSKHFIK